MGPLNISPTLRGDLEKLHTHKFRRRLERRSQVGRCGSGPYCMKRDGAGQLPGKCQAREVEASSNRKRTASKAQAVGAGAAEAEGCGGGGAAYGGEWSGDKNSKLRGDPNQPRSMRAVARARLSARWGLQSPRIGWQRAQRTSTERREAQGGKRRYCGAAWRCKRRPLRGHASVDCCWCGRLPLTRRVPVPSCGRAVEAGG